MVTSDSTDALGGVTFSSRPRGGAESVVPTSLRVRVRQSKKIPGTA